MSQHKSIQWLYDQLPTLVEKGILQPEAAEQLKQHYGPIDRKPPFQIAYIIAAVLGAILIGSGIILIFAYNWENLSIAWRTVFSMLPLIIAQLLYGYTFFRKNKNTAWVEATSAFLMLALGASIALISQTYNIVGSIEGFLFLWMLLSFPLMYLMNASIPAIFYLVGIASWALNTSGSTSVYYWGLLLIALPHVYTNSIKNWSSPRAYWLGWGLLLSVAMAFYNVFETDIAEYTLLAAAFLLSLYYLLGARLYRQDARWMSRPLQTFSVIALFIMSIVLCYEWPNGAFSSKSLIYGDDYLPWAGIINFVVFLLIIGAGIWNALRLYQQGKAINWLVPALPLVVLLGLLLTRSGGEVAAMVLANIYLLILGLYYIRIGIRDHQLALINLGMLFIAIQITARFFSTEWSPLIKGLIFVVLGICFLSANLYLTKRLKDA